MAEEHIKINPVPTKVKYSGNGVVREFPTGFAFFEDDNIVVYHNGVIINTGYSVTGVGETDGGVVTFDVAPAEGDKIVIIRKVAIERVTDFQEGGAFRAKNINDELDRQTAFCQQIQEEIDRCVKVEVTDDQTPEELLAEVYGKLDSATEVAEQAIGAANQATTAAKDAKDAVVVAQQQITETQAFIEQARTDINQTVEESIEYVEQEAVKAATEVVGEVVGQYTDRAETAAKNAEADANSAATSAASASANAIKAETNADEVAIYNFKNKITNCITEIPQDIKLELNNGTLTLKAGSVLYEPSGAGNFIKHTTTQDYSWAWGNNQFIILPQKNGNMGQSTTLAKAFSGATAPTNPSSGDVWYDTTNNVIKRYGTSWVAANFCLPIAITTNVSGKITSINQVFNGFGYIGSTVYILPGVKGLMPNGRNADGSLKNIECILSRVLITNAFNCKYMLRSNDVTPAYFTYYAEQEEQPSFVNGDWYQPSTNIMYRIANGVAVPTGLLYAFDLTASGGRATGLTPKLPFRAVDQNDFNKLDEEVVKTSGAQTIDDIKTFLDAVTYQGINRGFELKNPDYDSLTVPASQQIQYIAWTDKAGRDMSNLSQVIKPDGSVSLGITARAKKADGTSVNSVITVKALKDGTVYTSAPTPPASDNSTQIATTAWVNNKHKVVTSLPSTLDENTFYYIPE